jgi:serine/tyrosine/threonine adenylyltransferase
MKTNNPNWNFNNTYTGLPKVFFTRINPTPVTAPKLVILNEELAESLGLDAKALQMEEAIAVFAGNEIPEGAYPIAQAYAGHQFGHFNMLGDGRAILLGEHISPDGERVDIQLKGAGRTPYSRGGDGRAALGPMLREYIISEAMHALRIPTTRSLAVVTTGESIFRMGQLPGAILTRMAASHVRVGTFQFAAKFGGVEAVETLANYMIERHYPHVEDNENKYFALFKEVMNRQAQLIAKWQLVGFIHGVMNTDNMTISGETIDYGPCAFMDTYDPETVFSSIDSQGRYAYVNQPFIAGWNLARLVETLLPLLHEDEEKALELAQAEISGFTDLYHSYWFAGMRAKLGLFNEEEEDKVLIDNLLTLMQTNSADYTNTFRALTLGKLEGMPLFDTPAFKAWYEKWQARISRQEESKESSQQLMKENNPSVIPRNHRVEEALEAAEQRGDFSVVERLLVVLANPYAYAEEQEEYTKVPKCAAPYQTFCGT